MAVRRACWVSWETVTLLLFVTPVHSASPQTKFHSMSNADMCEPFEIVSNQGLGACLGRIRRSQSHRSREYLPNGLLAPHTKFVFSNSLRGNEFINFIALYTES